MIVLYPNDPKVHIYAGNLLMTTGAYYDASKAYQNADQVEETSEAKFHKARCYVALSLISKAIKELKQISSELLILPDLKCLQILNELSVGDQIEEDDTESD